MFGKIFNKLNIVIAFCIASFLAILAYAYNPYSADINDIDVSAYPMVRLDISLSSHPADEGDLVAKNLSIIENGKKNNGPIVVIPPGSYNNTIDLFILLDRSGNTKKYDKIIKSNLRALIKYMQDKSVDLNIKLVTFGSSGASYDLDLKKYSDNFNFFNDDIGTTAFDDARVERVFGLEKIYSLAAQSYRGNAEKVALIINGSQYYDQNRGDNTTFSIAETIHMLTDMNFEVFVAGFPIKQMVMHRTLNIGNDSIADSLTGSLAGGYLGSFSSDLTGIYDLLNKKNSSKYIVQYFSELSPESSSNGSVELDILDYSAGHFTYPQINNTQPDITHNPQPALFGEPYNVKINVNNHGKYINAVELVYWDADGKQESIFLEHRKSEDSGGSLIYEGSIPANDLSKGNFIYYFILHTPFRTIDLYADIYVTPVLEFDSGITLIPQLVNNKEVLWRWEGDTVNKGIKYQLYGGDKMIAETYDRYYTIPLGNCDLYQIVKVRVLIRQDADHPRVGGWSLFSLPAEYYAGPDGNVTEKNGIQEMFNCLIKKTATSFDDFVSNEKDYNPDNELHLNKMLEYLTGVFDTALREGMMRNRYPVLYYFMHFISYEEMNSYSKINNNIPYSILYKVITGINQTDDFSFVYLNAKNELAEWMLGHFSF